MKLSKGAFGSNSFQCRLMFSHVFAMNTCELRAPLLPSSRGYAIASSSDDRMNEPPTSLGLVPHQVSDLEMNLWSCSNPLMEGKVGSPPPSTNTTPTVEVSEGHSLRHRECFVQGTLPGGNEPMALPDLDVKLLTRLHHAGQQEGMGFWVSQAWVRLSPAVCGLSWPSLEASWGLVFLSTNHTELAPWWTQKPG